MRKEKTQVEKAFYSPSEVRSILGVQQAKVYELLENGTIPSMRIGSRWKIPKEALMEWIADTAKKQTAERRRHSGKKIRHTHME